MVYTEQSVFPIFLMNDPGFLFLNYLAQQCGISYEWFSAICSLAIMLLLYSFFNNICRKSMIPLFFYYATFYLIYSYSAMRQGFALAILLGLVYPLLRDGKTFKCIALILLVSLIHQSFLICILFLFVYKINASKRTLMFLLIPFALNLLLNSNIILSIPLPGLMERMEAYTDGRGVSSSIMAILVRFVVLLPVFLIPNRVYVNDENLKGVRNILVCGFMVYSLFSFDDIISSRLADYFRVFEGLFLGMLIYNISLKQIGKQLFVYFTIISTILFVKDINSFMDQGEYENCNVITYPFLTIFDDDNTNQRCLKLRFHWSYSRKYWSLGSKERLDFLYSSCSTLCPCYSTE